MSKNKDQVALYGTADITDIIRKKKTEAQTKVYTGKPPALVELTADQCKAACEKRGKEYKDGYEKRVLNYITTTETPDRYGDVVKAGGAKFNNYLRNPVVMFSHQLTNFPVGCSLAISIDADKKQVPADALFLDDRIDSSGRSDLVFKFAKSGFMPACSIGFTPLVVYRPADSEKRQALGLGEYGVEFREWDLMEFSPCSIPANPDALELAVKSTNLKEFNKEDIDRIAKVQFMGGNLLDRFAEEIKGCVGKAYSLPVTDKATEEAEGDHNGTEEGDKPTLDIGSLNDTLMALSIKIDDLLEGQAFSLVGLQALDKIRINVIKINEILLGMKNGETGDDSDDGSSDSDDEPDIYSEALSKTFSFLNNDK